MSLAARWPWAGAALLLLALDATGADRSADIRVRLRISDGVVAGTSDSVRDIQDILRDGDTAEGVVEAPPESSPDLMLVVTHRFSGLPGGSRRGNELGAARVSYTVRAILVDGRKTLPLEGRDIVWRQAADRLMRQVGEYAREQAHVLLRRRADWPAVGFDFEPLTKEHERELGAKGGPVLVTAVLPDGPAARGGLAVGDVLVKAFGRKLDSAGDLARALYEAPPGAALQLEIARAGAQRPLTLSRP